MYRLSLSILLEDKTTFRQFSQDFRNVFAIVDAAVMSSDVCNVEILQHAHHTVTRELSRCSFE